MPGYARGILKKPVGRVYVIAQRQKQDCNTVKQCRFLNCDVEFLSAFFEKLATCRKIIQRILQPPGPLLHQQVLHLF